MGQLLHSDLLKIIVDVRETSTRYLPIDNSLIPFDLLFKVGLAHASNEQLTVKSLFGGLPHSEMGMRYHFKRLLERGWVELQPSPADRRSKVVLPTEKLMDRFIELDAETRTIFAQSDLTSKL